MPYQIFGRKSTLVGKTLWEILGNLKNHGVGRVVTKSSFLKDPEPSWYRILEVQTVAPEGKIEVVPPVLDLGHMRRVRVIADYVYRNEYHGRELLFYYTYLPGFRLIPKEEEEAFTKVKRGELPPPFKPKDIHPSHCSFPPLFRELLIQELKAKGTYDGKEPMLPLIFPPEEKIVQAKEGEAATVEISTNLGTPACPKMYANIRET